MRRSGYSRGISPVLGVAAPIRESIRWPDIRASLYISRSCASCARGIRASMHIKKTGPREGPVEGYNFIVLKVF